MKTPPLLLGAAVVFWGWSADWLLPALLLGILLESPRVLNVRWDLSLKDFTRIADLTSVVFLGLLIYLFLNEGILTMGFLLLEWLPAIFFLLIAIQEYSTQEDYDVRALFWTLRRRQPAYSMPETRRINVGYPYVVACLLSAASMNVRTPLFYALLLLFAAWMLWAIRARHYSPVLWVVVAAATLAIGYRGQQSLIQLQRRLENSTVLIDVLRELAGMPTAEADPYQTATALGSVGQIKLGNEVVFRVRSEGGAYGSLLLREATYNVYQQPRWFAVADDFVGLAPEANMSSWVLLPDEILQDEEALNTEDYTPILPETPKRLLVSSRLEEGKGLLKLPADTARIDDLNVTIVQQNRFGVVRVDEGRGVLTYAPVFGSGQAIDSPPDTRRDLELPEQEAADLRRIVQQHNLQRATAEETVAAIREFFRQHFSYSLTLRRSRRWRAPILDFLENTRSGHCEYFATATVLLLRAAGVPARYAVGYSVAQVEPDGWTFVRGREAHAWTMVHLGGRWQNLDTTPPSWRPIERQNIASSFEWASEIWASVEFTFGEWWQRGYILRALLIVALALSPIMAVRLWRWYRRTRKVRRARPTGRAADAAAQQAGRDSAFFAIIEYLRGIGIPRHDGEPLSAWIQRLRRHLPPQAAAALPRLLHLHYQARFDPAGLSEDQRAAFQHSVTDWLRQVSQTSAS